MDPMPTEETRPTVIVPSSLADRTAMGEDINHIVTKGNILRESAAQIGRLVTFLSFRG
jgi:hypothetical protein